MATITDRLSKLLESVGAENDAVVKLARNKAANEDPGFIGGKSSQPSAKAENNEQKPPEGERTSENASYVKENVPSAVDSTSAATPGSTPTAEEVHVAPATSTGKDPANEDPDKKQTDDPGFIGGETAHPSGDQKYAGLTQESVQTLSDEALCKIAAELGSEVLADLATGYLSTKTAAKSAAAPAPAATPTTVEKAAAAGAKAASQAGELDAMAESLVKVAMQAHDDAELVFAYISEEHAKLQKQASDVEDASGPAAEGEDHGSDKPPAEGSEGGEGGGADPAAAAGAPAPGGGGGAELLAMMGGDAGGGGAPPPPAGDPLAGGPPPEMAGMGNDQALQQLAMALMELGIDPAQLAAAAGGGGGGAPPMPGGDPAMAGGPPGGDMGGIGPKLAQKVAAYKASGKFEVSEAKTAADRRVRNFMKSFIRDLVKR